MTGKTDTTAGKLLTGIDLLDGMNPADLGRLEQACSVQRYRAGEQILDRASDSRDVFFVVDGRVDIVNFSASGREVAYAQVPAGGFFGELSAIDGEPRSANVVANTACVVAALPPGAFADLLGREPLVAQRVLRRLARIVRTCDERIMDLATLGAVQRVYVELLRMAQPDPVRKGGWLIYPTPTQAQIAARASTTRETVARVVGHLEEAGLIQRKGKNTFIEERDRLAQLAERLGALPETAR